MSAARKSHPEDIELAKLIASAAEFSAYIRLGPHDKTVLRHLETYAEARAAADELDKTSRFGRRALVYAITPQGYSIPCDEGLLALVDKLQEERDPVLFRLGREDFRHGEIRVRHYPVRAAGWDAAQREAAK